MTINITDTKIDDDGVPTEKNALQMLRKLACLNARGRVPLTLPKFNDLTMDQNNTLFNDGVNTFLEFPENMKAKAYRAAMKMIAKLWRNHKSKLVNEYMAKELEPFSKYPYIKREDWEAFMVLKSSETFQMESSAKKQLRAKNKQNHNLGTCRYVGKRDKW